jgi:hypothetical protein
MVALLPVDGRATASEGRQGLRLGGSSSGSMHGEGEALPLLIQGFNWEAARWVVQHDDGKVDDIAAAGFTHVWLPPPSHFASNEGPPPLFTLKNIEDTADTGSNLCPCLLSEYQTANKSLSRLF